MIMVLGPKYLRVRLKFAFCQFLSFMFVMQLQYAASALMISSMYSFLCVLCGTPLEFSFIIFQILSTFPHQHLSHNELVY